MRSRTATSERAERRHVAVARPVHQGNGVKGQPVTPGCRLSPESARFPGFQPPGPDGHAGLRSSRGRPLRGSRRARTPKTLRLRRSWGRPRRSRHVHRGVRRWHARAGSLTPLAEWLLLKPLSLREKTLWTLLYESAARADSILALDIEDLDLENKRGRITAKGDILRWVHWQSGTARLLPRLIAGRTHGPLFLADPPARGRGSVPDHRPRPPVRRAGRVPVQAGHQDARPAQAGLHTPPAPAQPAGPPGRRWLVSAHAHGPVRT